MPKRYRIAGCFVAGATEVVVDARNRCDTRTFHYTGLSFDPGTGVATFSYLTRDTRGSETQFTDWLRFPVPESPPAADAVAAARGALELLYVAAGIVYYKVLAPGSVSIDAVQLSPAALRWAQALYHNGLAEFAYLHDLPHVLELEVRADHRNPVGSGIDLVDRAGGPLVAFGGGKDSIVSLEALTRAQLDPVLFAIRRAPLLEEIMAVAQRPMLLVDRRHDSVVPTLLKQGGYTGHVPVNATHTLAGIVVSLLHGLGPLVLSNERSASVANLTWRGHEVNHQWAKSIESHTLLREALREHAGLTNAAFSLLGGMSELHIAQLFATTSGYDGKATSCNHAFRVFNRKFDRWCTRCDKCRFVFLALAPFMAPDRLIGLIGRNMLDDPDQLAGYRELVGLAGHKPLECVGETTESRVALRLLTEHPRWRATAVVRALRAELTDWPSDAEVAAVFTATRPRGVPDAYVEAITAMQRSGADAAA